MWPFVLGLGCAWIALRSIYRLFFHPLSHIPGPKRAAISHAYEFYYDAICNGRYIWEIEKMHEKYGPVVRINPREVHIKDPYFYDEVYTPAARKCEKDPHFVGVFGFPTSMIATVGHELHRLRRGILNNFFSKKSVTALSSLLYENEAKLIKRLELAHEEDAVVRLDDAYAALTADVISHYSWGVSTGFLDDSHFSNDIREALNEISGFVHYNRFFPILGTIMRALPRRVLARLRPGATAVLDLQDMVTQSQAQKQLDGDAQKTIFDALTDVSVPPQEKSSRRLEDEGLIVVVAGTETTARTLTVASYYIFQNQPLLEKLREEIKMVMPTNTANPSWSELEQLPYLSAVVCESVRLSHGPIFRSTRVAPTEALQYKDLVIPRGTPVSMSSYFVHMDPQVFPEPERFKPERWIEAAEAGQHLKRFIVAFGRGSRICLGMNLAYAELYMTLASLIRRFDIELYDPRPEHIRIDREMGIGQPDEGEFLLRAKITKVIITQ